MGRGKGQTQQTCRLRFAAPSMPTYTLHILNVLGISGDAPSAGFIRRQGEEDQRREGQGRHLRRRPEDHGGALRAQQKILPCYALLKKNQYWKIYTATKNVSRKKTVLVRAGIRVCMHTGSLRTGNEFSFVFFLMLFSRVRLAGTRGGLRSLRASRMRTRARYGLSEEKNIAAEGI